MMLLFLLYRQNVILRFLLIIGKASKRDEMSNTAVLDTEDEHPFESGFVLTIPVLHSVEICVNGSLVVISVVVGGWSLKNRT